MIWSSTPGRWPLLGLVAGMDQTTKINLLTSAELNTKLEILLLQQNILWVLSIINIDDLKQLNDRIGYKHTDDKIQQTAKTIYEFCNQKPSRMISFKHNDNNRGKGNVFAILFNCQKKNKRNNKSNSDVYIFAKSKMQLIIDDVNKSCSVSISAGLVPINTKLMKSGKQYGLVLQIKMLKLLKNMEDNNFILQK